MRNILYFVLLVAVLGSSNLFSAEQLKEELNKKIDTNESAHETDNIKKRLEQNLPNNINQEEKLKDKLEPSNNDTVELDNLNTKQIQEIENQGSEATKLPKLRKITDEDKKNDKMSPDLNKDPLADQTAENSPNVIEKKNLETESLPLDASLNDNIAEVDNLQKDSQEPQSDKKIHVKERELSENNIDQLSKEADVSKIESQDEEKKVKETNDNFKDSNRKNRVKPITKKDEKDAQSEDENLQKWTKLDKEPVKEWIYKNTQSKSIYKRQYDSLNEHLPTTVFIHDYSKQLFYCIKKSNLSCLRGIISKLEKIGLTIKQILKFRNKLGDTPLIYAVKQGEIDVVRFLLLQGSDLSAVNYNFKSPIDIAIEKKQIDIINVITEMTPHLLEHSRINSKEDSTMYGWAVNTKENNESQCDEK